MRYYYWMMLFQVFLIATATSVTIFLFKGRNSSDADTGSSLFSGDVDVFVPPFYFVPCVDGICRVNAMLFLVMDVLSVLGVVLLIYFALRFFLNRGLFSSVTSGSSSGSVSRFRDRITHRTKTLFVQLDTQSGDITGKVKAGPFAGRALADLEASELLDLLAYCEDNDPKSATILETYCDRTLDGDWRDHGTTNAGAAGNAEDRMTPERAEEILGVEPEASAEEIRAAHKRMIRTHHSDAGGSDYIAALVNTARDVLLAERMGT